MEGNWPTCIIKYATTKSWGEKFKHDKCSPKCEHPKHNKQAERKQKNLKPVTGEAWWKGNNDEIEIWARINSVVLELEKVNFLTNYTGLA